MKNIIVIGLVSLVLFGVSAGLSVWLQSNGKPADTAHEDKDKKKKAADDHGDGKDGHGDAKEKDKGGDHGEPKGTGKEPHAEVKPPSSKEVERAEYRRLQMEVVAADLNGQMQDYDKLLKKVAGEMKQLLAKQDELDAKAVEVKEEADRTAKTVAQLKKSQSDGGEDEQANITRMAAVADQLSPASAAQLFQQFADSGKTDLAVKIIAQMKERTAAKALDAITDPTLPPVIFAKLQKLKKAAPPAEMP